MHKNLSKKSDENRPLERPRCRWEDIFKMDVKEIEVEDVDWNYVAKDRDQCRSVVNRIMKLVCQYNTKFTMENDPLLYGKHLK
jgi:hypothetical protein